MTTVKDLIQELQKLDQDKTIVVESSGSIKLSEIKIGQRDSPPMASTRGPIGPIYVLKSKV